MPQGSKQSAPMEPNLTNINYFGRLFVKYGIAFLLVLMVGRFLFNAVRNYWVATHPAPPPAPTYGFGILPQPEFPLQADEDKPNSYVLEMAGNLEEINDQAKVLMVVKSTVNLLADEKVKELAANYGFIFSPANISNQNYRFSKNSPLDMTFEISSADFTFSLNSNYLSRPELISSQNTSNLPEEFEAVDQVKSFLRASDLLGTDIATASANVTYLKSIGGNLEDAVSLSDADFVKVDLNRNSIDGIYRTYTPEGEKGIVSAILTGAFSGNNSIVEMDYYYRLLDYLNTETYSLRSVRSAWKTVQAGEAYIAAGQDQEEAVVRDYELAYYDSFDDQNYLQPIYVFKGDNGFLAFVPAVAAEYLSRN
jgi:hypothetical protein